MGKHWTVSSLLTASCAVLVAAQETSVFSKTSNDSLLWGPYRSNLYFGIRPRVPKSLKTGLLWARVEDYTSVQHNTRYTCEQHEVAGYGWNVYDPRTGGAQVIHDQGNGIDIETTFVKFDDGQGGWAARIKGTPREDAPPLNEAPISGGDMKTAVWFTVAAEGLGSVAPQNFDSIDDKGYKGNVVFEGQTNDLGDFKLTIAEPQSNSHPSHAHQSYENKPLDRTFVHSLQVPEEALWQSKALLFQSMKATVDEYIEQYTKEKMPPPWQTYTIQNKPGQGNMHIVQKVFEGPFEFDVFYTPSGVSEKSSKDLTEAVSTSIKQFAEKFIKVNMPLAPFTDRKYLDLSRSLFSNLVGGLSYFYGDQAIDRSYAAEYEEENEGFWEEAEEARNRNMDQIKAEGPYNLFTTVPSRPFFPRGFLWDEGFHLLPILDWDAELVMQIISSWFNTMDDDGWIPREQILGEEARSKVPPEFRVQYPHYGNPPTLFIALEAMLDKLEGTVVSGAALNLGDVNGKPLATPESVKAWLKKLYPYLQRNFDWYRRTQWGDVKSYDREAFSSKEAYRWRGRTPRHILTSGLDDYPRAQPPHPGELHVDLLSCLGLMSRNIYRIAKFLGETDDEAKYGKILEAIRHNVNDLHWSKEHKTYCDATIDDYEESTLVCHKGYISVFPFMCGLLGPDHEHLKDTLDLIADEEELWSPFGIRSLSRKSEFYGTDENYWRSPVWMNLNYLIINQLYTIAQQSGPQQKRAATMYSSLRKNLVETVYRSWQETGFAWEQYNPETGEGQRTQHFTGWTSLVVKIMAMPDLGKKGHDEL